MESIPCLTPRIYWDTNRALFVLSMMAHGKWNKRLQHCGHALGMDKALYTEELIVALEENWLPDNAQLVIHHLIFYSPNSTDMMDSHLSWQSDQCHSLLMSLLIHQSNLHNALQSLDSYRSLKLHADIVLRPSSLIRKAKMLPKLQTLVDEQMPPPLVSVNKSDADHEPQIDLYLIWKSENSKHFRRRSPLRPDRLVLISLSDL